MRLSRIKTNTTTIHTVEYDPFIQGQLALHIQRFKPDDVHFFSRYPPNSVGTKSADSSVWITDRKQHGHHVPPSANAVLD